MTNPVARLSGLRRPRLLIRAARCGQAGYSRDRHLARLIGAWRADAPAQTVDALLSEERAMEEKRKAGDAAYSIPRHIALLIAIMAEAGPCSMARD